jgi:hypothetical protein
MSSGTLPSSCRFLALMQLRPSPCDAPGAGLEESLKLLEAIAKTLSSSVIRGTSPISGRIPTSHAIASIALRCPRGRAQRTLLNSAPRRSKSTPINVMPRQNIGKISHLSEAVSRGPCSTPACRLEDSPNRRLLQTPDATISAFGRKGVGRSRI